MCSQEVEVDGLSFLAETIRVEHIRDEEGRVSRPLNVEATPQCRYGKKPWATLPPIKDFAIIA